MKIFKNNLNKIPKSVHLRTRRGDIGKIKYLPSFSKEWKNTIYCYNKNYLKNIPVNNININKIIKSYFNLYFKNYKFVGSRKFILLKRRRNFLRRIYVSNAEIKHTNNKAIITLYTVNRESLILKKKYLKINKMVSKKLIKRFLLLYKKNASLFKRLYLNISAIPRNITGVLQKRGRSKNPPVITNRKDEVTCIVKRLKKNKYLYTYFFYRLETNKKKFWNDKLQYFNKLMKINTICKKKIWSLIFSKYWKRYCKLLRKYDLLYSLNKYKFNKQIFLPILSKILNKIIRKKIQYNIINLKSITYNTDILTNALALKLKRRNHPNSNLRNMFSILNRAYLPVIDTSQISLLKLKQERSIHLEKKNLVLNAPYKYKDLNLISRLGLACAPGTNNTTSMSTYPYSPVYTQKEQIKTSCETYTKTNFDNLLGNCSNIKQVHNTIYNSIGYKNMRGIRLEIKGRLTKRYRADRSIYSLKWKGGLKNLDSSLKGLSSVLFRGNSPSNISYSIQNSKRRIGAFAVKGWISGG